MDSVRIWARDLGMNRKREDRKTRRGISKVGYGTEQQNASLLCGKGGTAKREIKREGRVVNVGV